MVFVMLAVLLGFKMLGGRHIMRFRKTVKDQMQTKGVCLGQYFHALSGLDQKRLYTLAVHLDNTFSIKSCDTASLETLRSAVNT